MRYIKSFVLSLCLIFSSICIPEEKNTTYVVEYWEVTKTEVNDNTHYTQLTRITDNEVIIIKKYMIEGTFVIGIRFLKETNKLEYTYFFTSTKYNF